MALVDDDGTFVGNSLEWLYVTEDRRQASEVARLQTAVDNTQTAHQRRLLEDTSIFPYETEIVVGPLNFALPLNAIHDDQGNYIGNSLEWLDITAQKAAQSQIESLISDATNGKLTQIIEMTQQNSALVEEVAAASDATEEKAKGLAELMTFFNIGDTGGGGAPAARPATAPAAAPPAAPAAMAPSSAPAAKPGKGEDWEGF